jgi:hypothetical protein
MNTVTKKATKAKQEIEERKKVNTSEVFDLSVIIVE